VFLEAVHFLVADGWMTMRKAFPPLLLAKLAVATIDSDRLCPPLTGHQF